MHVVKVVSTSDKVFSQELATRCGSGLVLDTVEFAYDHSSDGYDIFQDHSMIRGKLGVVLNARVVGTVLVSRADSKPCRTADVVALWPDWTACPDLPPVNGCGDAGIHANNGTITKKPRKSKEDREVVPEEKENEDSCEEDDESEDEEAVDDDDTDDKGGEIVIE